jgi:hypothetical protein
VSRAHVIEDDGQVLKTSAASSVGPVQEEDQHQEPDGEIQSTFYQICYLLPGIHKRALCKTSFISFIPTGFFIKLQR